jgi:hypothetical protein
MVTRLTSVTSLVIRVEIFSMHLVRQSRPVGGHRVLRGHRTQHDRVTVRTPSPLDPDRTDVGQQHDRHLPDLAVETSVVSSSRAIASAWRRMSRRSRVDGTDDADAQPGSGERLAPHDRSGRPSCSPTSADLVLEERAERLDERELMSSGRPPTLWWDLIVGGAGAHHRTRPRRGRACPARGRTFSPGAASPKTRPRAASKVRMNSGR